MIGTSQKINGVYYLTSIVASFSEVYTLVREKEGRVLTDQEAKRLSYSLNKNKNNQEWQLRHKSTGRFISYLKSKEEVLSVLDIGSGNGWFTNLISKISKKNTIIGIDINVLELEQAARVFTSENLEFVYGDLFQITKSFEMQFDIITLNACVQYFSSFERLLLKLQSFLKPEGEIHILDSPFYKPLEIEAAKKRTQDYYKIMDVSEMSNHYFHHSIKKIKGFEVLYSPSRNIFNKIFKRKDSPFMWLRFIKPFV